MKFDVPKPFDVICCIEGMAIAIEAKYLPKLKAFPLSAFQPSQIKGLTEFHNSGHEAFAVLNIRQAASVVDGIKRMNRLYVFEWFELLNYLQRNKSIKAKELEKLPFTEGSKGGFDVNNISVIYDIDRGGHTSFDEFLF